ncbi:acetylornithine deacetylase [Bosea sp. NBC_00550]|uniref:acetylornithine deacetylase n=1 Tax=Bosea sp. NBC_00550 TaxID=2969621 RepID=UPI00222E48BC|nr:acetylornithine deacetylase [Bosea sp. NBC_00550]UZF94850.1 acetylornithine deacetylase [Bosea sp. NBC_00550]
MTPEEILKALIQFPSVVGRPNAAIAGWIAQYLDDLGIEAQLLTGPEGDRVNLFATIGPRDVPGLVLSGHMDVVPAQEPQWSAAPFQLRMEGDKLFGRGTSDMKGFLAAALAIVPTLVALKPARPIHLAFSYDEEAGCRGVPHLIAALPSLCALPVAAVIGEPSGLRPILAHKGKAAARVEVHGRAGHSSRPDLGLNAIHAMGRVIAAANDAATGLSGGPLDPVFEPPYSTIQIGTIRGGDALNIIPESCIIEIEARAIAGVSPATLLEPVREALESLRSEGFETSWQSIAGYPALSLPAQAPIARLLAQVTGKDALAAVSYGTEAGLYQAAGIDAIICGPGDIVRAHKPDEYITRDELAGYVDMLERLCAEFAQKAP